MPTATRRRLLPLLAAPVVAQNLRRAMAGQPLLHLVDRDRGY